MVIALAELVIRNARLVLPEGIVRGELSIEGGRISEIAVSGLTKGDQEIDAKDRIVMPGVIDAHVHFYDRKLLHREDFRSGSTAAAAGGITTVIVAPLDTSILMPRSIRGIIRAGQENSLVDFAIHAGNMTAESTKNVPKIASLGIKSFKASTCAPHTIEYKALEELMRTVKTLGGITSVHAEDEGTLRKKTKELLGNGRKDPLAHADAHPNEAEENAAKKVVNGARRTGCRLHLAPITTRQGCEIVSNSKKKRLKVSAETCPHFLIFTRNDMTRLGPFLKVNPALKTSEDCAALWSALANGTIDIVTTDHAPTTRKEKEKGWKNIWEVPAGLPGVETLLPLMLTEGVGKGRLTLEKMVDVLCARPAQIFGFYPRKGVIREGSDADLVVVDLQHEITITGRKLHYKVDWTPYEGMRLKGISTMTISRGLVLMKDGDVIGKPEHGQFLAV